MPDKYIIYRDRHKNNGAARWKKLYSALPPKQKEEFHCIVHKNSFDNGAYSKSQKVKALLVHYKKRKQQSEQLRLFDG